MTRIIRLQAENFKRLVAVDIQADGNLVVLSGKNRQGKTSILDAILAVLKGRKFTRETSQTIRDGQSEAWVRIEIGDDAEHIQYIATRRWTKEDAGTLTVESADHAKYSSPQSLLDAIVGEISFDPMSFLDLGATEQAEALVTALGSALPFDLHELVAKRDDVFDQRTEVNRQIRDLEGQLAGYPEVDPSLPTDEQSASELIAEAESARQTNAQIDRAIETLATLQTGVEDAERALKSVQENLTAVRDAYDRQMVVVQSAPERIDVGAIMSKLDSVEETNAKVRAQNHRAAVAAELADRKAESDNFSAEIDAIDKQKEDGIAAAKFPVPELSFSDDGVTYAGRAFSQASTEERIRASFGVAIASNPELRVCRIDKGEALDSESLKVLGALADEHDMQVWISRVDESGSIGFVIEEGQVAA